MFKKAMFLPLAAVIFCSGITEANNISWPKSTESEAFRKYQNRTRTELSKLIYLMDRFNAAGVEIKFDGALYPAEKAFPYSKSYLAKNYKKEDAESWIRQHCYRSLSKNEIMYMKVPGDEFKPVRDVLIHELQNLRMIEK